MIKLKTLLTEAKEAKHGFDLTEFKPGGFERVLRAIAATPKGRQVKQGGIDVWRWVGKRPIAGKHTAEVIIYAKNHPLTGEPSGEKNYASYMAVVGHKEGVKQVVKFIKQEASYIKDESPGRRDYI